MLRSIKSLLRAGINAVLHQFGYTLAPYPSAPPIHLDKPGVEAIAARYFSHFRPVLLDVEISRGRGLRVFRLDSNIHPFVKALKSAPGEERESHIRATLRTYYEMTQPSSAAEWLDLPAGMPLSAEPPWAVTMPWDARTPQKWREEHERHALRENREHQQYGTALTITDGWHFWGPVSEAKLEIETRRLNNLATSVLEKGLLRHDGRDGDVGVVVLTRDSDWRWQVIGGEHRAAAFSALGHTTIPVRVLQVVSRADVDHWPGVLRGDFTRQSALDTFDMVFDGRVPSVARAWRKRVSAATASQERWHPRRSSALGVQDSAARTDTSSFPAGAGSPPDARGSRRFR